MEKMIWAALCTLGVMILAWWISWVGIVLWEYYKRRRRRRRMEYHTYTPPRHRRLP